MAYLELQRVRRPDVQRRIDKLAYALFSAWALLMLVVVVKLQGDALGFFAPYLYGVRVSPWSRGQIGSGFSSLISFASYLQIFLTSACGVIAALSLNPKTRSIAIVICFLSFPYYIFDRTRNTMLAAVMPGILAYILMRLRLGWAGKCVILGVAFLVVNLWLVVVMANREGMRFDIAGALRSISDDSELKGQRHEGLNMFEELAWIQHFSDNGSYEPNWGKRYFAELVNPVPRALWRNKPTIGLDYAVARGQLVVGSHGETTATIATGMIGQGVVNFGRILGPAASAFLMSLWTVTLARQDLLGSHPGRIILYGTGTILTFNLGRDITLLVLYPFIFGLILFHLWVRYGGGAEQVARDLPMRNQGQRQGA
jgi:hypothetical protein